MITSIQNETIKKIMKLKQKKYRDLEDQFLIEGYHLVEEAKKANCIETIITTLHETFEEPTIYVSSNVMEKLAFTKTPQPIMAICHKPHHRLFNTNHQRYLLLDNIQDPGNLGTIIRSAAAFHIDTIVLGENTVDLYNPKTIRSTQGMLFHVNVIKRELSSFLDELKEQDIPIYGTRVEYGEDVRSLHTNDKNKFALIMGNEGAGVSPEILEKCDKYLYIKMDDAVESLNVSIATSIILYELDRRD